MIIEQTLAIIKPDAINRNLIGSIINLIEQNNLNVKDILMRRISTKEAKEFYKIHTDREFFSKLIEYMTSGPIVVMLLEGDDAVNRYRIIMGSTNPDTAENGTIRKLYGLNTTENSVHGSDSIDNADIEIKFFFK